MSRRKSHQRSSGTMISTVCFFIMGVFFALQASEFSEAGYGWQSVALWVCSAACIAGGLRFVLHDLLGRVKGRD